jgi:hypothetical protein
VILFVSGRGRPSNDAKPLRRELAEFRNHFFGKAVTKKVLFRISAEIVERKHYHSDLVRRGTVATPDAL